jgi:hypothetical protein
VYCDDNNTQAQRASARSLLEFLTVVPSRTTATPVAFWRDLERKQKARGKSPTEFKKQSKSKIDSPLSNTWKRLNPSSAIARYDVSESYSVLDSPIHIQVGSILNSALRPLKTKFLERRLWKSGPVVLTLTRVVLTDNAFELLLTPLFHTALVEREEMSVPRRLDAECSALQLSCQVRATSRQAALRLPYITQHYWFLPEHATIISRL